jgi:hypothetical protein
MEMAMNWPFTSTDFISAYAAVISTLVVGWEIWKWRDQKMFSKSERSKIQVYFGIPVITKLPDNLGKMPIFPLCISNLGREPVIIVSVEMRQENGGYFPGAYNEPYAMLGVASERMLPRLLNPGDTLQLEQFTDAAFRETPKKVLVTDSEGREHEVPEHLLQYAFHDVQRVKAKMERESVENNPALGDPLHAAFAPRT